MANASYVESLVGNLPPEHRLAWKRAMDYVLNNLRLGPVANQVRSENLQAYYLTATTPATALQEFSVAHGLGRIPYVLVPVLSLDSINQQIVPLSVSREADAQRVYLKSSSTSAAVAFLVE
jgi:hypothetical protein